MKKRIATLLFVLLLCASLFTLVACSKKSPREKLVDYIKKEGTFIVSSNAYMISETDSSGQTFSIMYYVGKDDLVMGLTDSSITYVVMMDTEKSEQYCSMKIKLATSTYNCSGYYFASLYGYKGDYDTYIMDFETNASGSLKTSLHDLMNTTADLCILKLISFLRKADIGVQMKDIAYTSYK